MYQEENLHISSDSGCAEIRERLSAYLDGELSAAEVTALEAHLAVCPACADEAEKLRRLRAELAAAALTPPPALRAKVLAAVRREKRARMIRRFTSIGAVGIAAMFCVIVIGGFIGFGGEFDQDVADLAPMANRAAEEPLCPAEVAPSQVADEAESVFDWSKAESVSVKAVRLPADARGVTELDLSTSENAMFDAASIPSTAALAEEQMGTLCIIETARDLSAPQVYDLSSGRRLTLLAFVGGAEMLSRLAEAVGAKLTEATLYRPTAAGLTILIDGEQRSLSWSELPVLLDCIERWQMNRDPLVAPDGSVSVES